MISVLINIINIKSKGNQAQRYFKKRFIKDPLHSIQERILSYNPLYTYLSNWSSSPCLVTVKLMMVTLMQTSGK